MLIAETFLNNTYFYISILGLVLFYFASKCATKGGVVNKAILNCFRGYLACFVSSFILVNAERFSSVISLVVFLELTCLLMALYFFISCASQILLRIKPKLPIIMIILTMGTIINIYFVYILPDGAVINNLRTLYPLLGFSYLSIAFWLKTSKTTLPYIIGASISTVVSVQYLSNFITFRFLDFWWLAPLTYFLMTIVALLMRSVELSVLLASAKKSVAENTQKIKEIIYQSPYPVLISRISDDKIIVANENAQNLFGIYVEDLEKYKLKDFFADQSARKKLSEVLELGHGVKEFEFLADTQSAFSPFWLSSSASIIDYDSNPSLYMAFQDITSRKNKESILKEQALKDPLTGIYNRRYFEDMSTQKIKESKKLKETFAILMLDADHFKNVNDTYGHKSGDNVLITLANICDKALRDNDIAARFGGEEFVLFLSDIDEQKAVTVANRLRESISKLVVKSDNNEDIKFTVSIGVCSSAHSNDLSTLIKNADLALYKAKENGRNRVEAYKKEFDKDAHKLESKKDTHHPIYDTEQTEEVSLINENDKK